MPARPNSPQWKPSFPPSGAPGPVGTCLLSHSWAWASHALFLLLAVGAETRKNIIGGSTSYIHILRIFIILLFCIPGNIFHLLLEEQKQMFYQKRSTLGAKFQTPFILEGSGFQSDGCKLHTFVFPHPCSGSSWFLCLQSPKRNGLLTVKWSVRITRTWLSWVSWVFLLFPSSQSHDSLFSHMG